MAPTKRKANSRGAAKKKTPPPSPAPKISEQLEEQLAREALAKRKAGKKPTARELAALKRIEARQHAVTVRAYCEAVPQKDLREMLGGMQNKQLQDWQANYNLPVAKPTVNLYEFFPALRKLIADNKGSISGDGDNSELNSAKTQKTQKEVEKLNQQIEQLKRDNLERDAKLKSIDEVHRTFNVIAGCFRQASEQLFKRHGEDAYRIVVDAVEIAQKHFESLLKE